METIRMTRAIYTLIALIVAAAVTAAVASALMIIIAPEHAPFFNWVFVALDYWVMMLGILLLIATFVGIPAYYILNMFSLYRRWSAMGVGLYIGMGFVVGCKLMGLQPPIPNPASLNIMGIVMATLGGIIPQLSNLIPVSSLGMLGQFARYAPLHMFDGIGRIFLGLTTTLLGGAAMLVHVLPVILLGGFYGMLMGLITRLIWVRLVLTHNRRARRL